MTTKTDIELMELAAKAAGIEIVPCTCRYEQWPFKYAEGQEKRGHWNPLADDGDALRLAVKLKIDIHQRVVEPRVAAIAAMQSPKIESVADEKQRLAATRRAIVRAAAAIGEKMP